MRSSVLFPKMMTLTFTYLVIFAGGCSAGVVPQNFKANHSDPLHSEVVPSNSDTDSSSFALENFEIQTASSAAFGDDNLRNASQTPTVQNISESSRADVLEESYSVKTALKEKKTSKESISRSKKNFRKGIGHHMESDTEDHFNNSAPNRDHLEDFAHPDDVLVQAEHIAKDHFNKSEPNGEHLRDFAHPDDVSELPEHVAKDLFNTTASNGDNLGDFFHPNDVSEQPEHVAKDHFDIRSNHSVDFARESNFLENTSKKLDSEEDTSKTDLITNSLNPGMHVADITINLNYNNSDNLNDSTVDSLQQVASFGNFAKPMTKVNENILTELKMNSQPISENENDTLKDFVTPQTSEHFGDTSGQLNQAAASLTNSKLFLNIHNSFMNLKHADRSNSTQFNHSYEDLIVHEDLGKNKIDGENVTSFEKRPESEITIGFKDFNSSEINHKMSLNDTEKLSSEIDIQASDKNEDEIHSNSDFSDGFNKDHIITSNTSALINSKNLEPVLRAENNATQGLFSTLGFDFLLNSELAKNAASALEVFNFTDSDFTDHIIDDKSDMHDFLDLMHSVDESDPSLRVSSSTIDAESSTQVDREENHRNSTVTLNLFQEETFLNQTKQVESESDPISPLSDFASSENDGNFEFTATNPSQPMLNSTVEFEVTPQPMLNSTVEFEVNTIQPMPNSSVEVVSESKCPPPGFCIFWFFAQDTCAVNNHCLGSRSCCRIGCAKTCIEI